MVNRRQSPENLGGQYSIGAGSSGFLGEGDGVMLRNANLIGPNVIKLRHSKGWTQEVLVSKLQLVGFYITRDVLVNIELRRSTVTDVHIRAFADVFGVTEGDLFPPKRPGNQTMWLVDQLTARRRRRSGNNGSLPDDE